MVMQRVDLDCYIVAGQLKKVHMQQIMQRMA
jgi:hypothetical protein